MEPDVGKTEEISDETIAAGMLENDFIVRLPPVREYILHMRIQAIEKATLYRMEGLKL